MLKLVLILIAVLAIAACGGDSADQIIGIWKATYEGDLLVVSFDNNGRCTLSGDGDTEHGTYFVSGNLLHINVDGDTNIIAFSISKNLMTWGNGSGDIIIFERS